MNEVVAEAGRLKKLLATSETDGAAGIKRAISRIKFDPIGTKFSVPELNQNVSFSDRRLGFGVGVLAVSPDIEARR